MKPVTLTEGSNTVKVTYSATFEEYTVRAYVDGKHVKAADYFTNDKEDALSTAKEMVHTIKP